MKEASGELSMTAVAVVAIAAVGVLFTTLIWPNIKGSITSSTKCSAAFDCTSTKSGTGKCTGKTCWCSYYKEDGTVSSTAEKIQCKNPNG